MVEELMENFRKLCARMSVKMHFLRSHLDYFPENCKDFREELIKRFHQELRDMEEHYQDRWDIRFLADYYLCLKCSLLSTSGSP